MANYEMQYPDFLRSAISARMAPGMLQEQQQQLQAGQLGLDQTRQALAFRQQAAAQSQQAFQQSQQAPQDGADPNASAWGVGQVLGVNVPQSQLASQAREYMGIAQGMNPVEAHLKEAQSQEADYKARQELIASKMLAPDSPISAAVNFANMQGGNAAALKANPALFAQWEQIAKQSGIDPGLIYSSDPAVADKAVQRAAYAFAFPALAQVDKQGILNKPEEDISYTREKGPGGSLLQVQHGGKDNGKASELVGRAPASSLAASAPPLGDDNPDVKAAVHMILSGNGTMQQVPMPLRTATMRAMDNAPKAEYSPMAQQRLTRAASLITRPYTEMSAYKLTADGKPYLERISAALANPGSVSDQDLLDSLTKLNTGGNAITDAQVSLVTNGKSFADTVNTFRNKFKNGGVLSDSQRQQINSIATAIYANYQKGYQPVYEKAAAQLTEAGIPKAFWTIPDLNAINGPAGGSPAPSGAPAKGWGKAVKVGQ